jgi:hypothetical protein
MRGEGMDILNDFGKTVLFSQTTVFTLEEKQTLILSSVAI